MVIRIKTYIVCALKSPISIIWPSEEKSAISCRIRFQRLFLDDW